MRILNLSTPFLLFTILRSLTALRSFSLLIVAMLLTQSVSAVEIGKPAPEFKASAADGKKYELANLKGQFVVLEWFNNDCPYVEKHYGSQNMQKLQKKFTDKKVVWLTVASSAPKKQGHLTADTAKTVMKERQSKATALLLDGDGTIGKLYGAKTTPHMFIIDPKGLLIYEGAIDDNSSSRASTIEGAKNYVDLALTEALAKKPLSNPSSKAYGCSVKYL